VQEGPRSLVGSHWGIKEVRKRSSLIIYIVQEKRQNTGEGFQIFHQDILDFRHFFFFFFFTSHARDIVEFQPRSISTFLVFFFFFYKC